MILVNSLLIGVETYVKYDAIGLIQTIILYVFTIEIAMRFVAANSIMVDKGSRGYRELKALTADLEKENVMAKHQQCLACHRCK